MVGIPQNLGHIWIGPLKPPVYWMQSWVNMHPGWSYELFGNDYLKGREWRCQAHIEEYMKRGEYAGVANIMRYEILLEQGGFIAPADAVCIQNMSCLFTRPTAYTVYENEFLRGKLVAPVLACEPRNPFVASIIEAIKEKRPEHLLEPWKSTGNMLVARLIETLQPKITVFPSYYMNPEHYEGLIYDGPGPLYAKQMFGSTLGRYGKLGPLHYFANRQKRKYRKEALTRAYQNTERREWLFHLKEQEQSAQIIKI